MRTTRLITLLLLVAGLNACGSSGTTPSGGAIASARTADQTGKSLAFARCMRTHGVTNFPDPPSSGRLDLRVQALGSSMNVNGVQVNAPAFRAALQSCHSYLPNGGQPSAGVSAKTRQAALAFARCMRAHGVPNFPDPQFSVGAVAIHLAPAVAPDSPSFKTAQQACRSLLPTGGP